MPTACGRRDIKEIKTAEEAPVVLRDGVRGNFLSCSVAADVSQARTIYIEDCTYSYSMAANAVDRAWEGHFQKYGSVGVSTSV